MAKKSKALLVNELLEKKRANGDKKSRSRSCLLCQKRKQKCDHRLPSCSTCIKAGVECIQPEKYSDESPLKDDYTIILEKRVLYLEKLIDSNLGVLKNPVFSRYKRLSPFIAKHEFDDQSIQKDGLIFEEKYGNKDTNSEASKSGVNNSSAMVKTTSFDPHFDFGDFNSDDEDFAAALEIPTFSLMNDPMRQIPKLDVNGRPVESDLGNEKVDPSESSLFAKFDAVPSAPSVQSIAQSMLPMAGPIDLSRSILRHYDLKEFTRYDPEYDLDPNLSFTLLDTHFVRFQMKFPFLDEEEVFKFYHSYTNNDLGDYMSDKNYFQFCCCRMWMIFSLNSFILKTTGDYSHLEPHRLFSTALRYLAKCNITDPYQQIEIYLLTILCLIRCDRDSVELYRIIGDAMHVALSMRLHRLEAYENCSESEKLKKMKCFWCVYLLDRLIAVSIGKPFSVSEKEIDAEIPLFARDPNTSTLKTESAPPQTSPRVLFINQCIKLKRIEATAIESLDIVGTNSERTTSKSELPLVEFYFEQLQAWRTESAEVAKEVESATLGLYYFRTVRTLIQPYLELMLPEDRLLKECQAAAGQICQLFKVFHEKTVYGHSTLAINNVFVAGVTLIYCLWLTRNVEDKRRRLLGDTAKHTKPTMTASLLTSLDDLKACSICLYVMAERSKYAKVFRDTFDQLLRATIGNLIERCGPDSSEVIYEASNNKPYYYLSYAENGKKQLVSHKKSAESNMPPAVVRKPVSHYELICNGRQEPKSSEQIEEIEESKRKRGALEKSAVPKSLSHLLISKNAGSGSGSGSGNGNAGSSGNSGNTGSADANPGASSNADGFLSEFQTPSPAPGAFYAQSENLPSIHEKGMASLNSVPSLGENELAFTDRANDMISNISNWTEESGPITFSYMANNFIPPELLGASATQNSKPNQVYINLSNINHDQIASPTVKRRKFDTKSLFNGRFNSEMSKSMLKE